MTKDVLFKLWTSAVAIHGNSINGLYLGILITVEILAVAALMVAAALLYIFMIPHSAIFLHERLLQTVQNAPLSFFTSTDAGQVVNR